MAERILKWLGIVFGIAAALVILLVVGFYLLIVFSASGSDAPRRDGSWQRQISIDLQLNVKSASVLYEKDTHGGFLGDGTTLVALQLRETAMAAKLAEQPNWRALPLPEILYKEVYDNFFFRSEEGDPLVQPVENGYYFFLDRHSMAEDIFDPSGLMEERYSSNYTIGIYDADENILYYLELDT